MSARSNFELMDGIGKKENEKVKIITEEYEHVYLNLNGRISTDIEEKYIKGEFNKFLKIYINEEKRHGVTNINELVLTILWTETNEELFRSDKISVNEKIYYYGKTKFFPLYGKKVKFILSQEDMKTKITKQKVEQKKSNDLNIKFN